MIARLGGDYADSFTTEDFRFVVSCAGLLEESLWREFEERFRTRVVNLFGLTETVTGSLFSGPSEETRRVGTLGKPVDCEARVVDASGSDVPRGETGELWLRGEHLMSGYLQDAAATAQVLQQGWLRTGDLVQADPDGFFRIVGRSKDIIVCGGLNIAPAEVDEVLHGHPGVKEAAVIGVPDPSWGEKPVAAVVRMPGTPLEPSDLYAFCRERLAGYKIPREIVFVDALPRGRTGKVTRSALQELLRESARAAAPQQDADVLEAVLTLAASCFHVPVARLSAASTPDRTSGWDSMAHMDLMARLEERFAVRLSTRDIMSVDSLGRAAAVVRELRASVAAAQ